MPWPQAGAGSCCDHERRPSCHAGRTPAVGPTASFPASLGTPRALTQQGAAVFAPNLSPWTHDSGDRRFVARELSQVAAAAPEDVAGCSASSRPRSRLTSRSRGEHQRPGRRAAAARARRAHGRGRGRPGGAATAPRRVRCCASPPSGTGGCATAPPSAGNRSRVLIAWWTCSNQNGKWCYPLQCSHGHEWQQATVIVSWQPCDCPVALASPLRAASVTWWWPARRLAARAAGTGRGMSPGDD